MDTKKKRPTKWDSKAGRTSRRIDDLDKVAMLRVYESDIREGKPRDEVLEALAKKFSKKSTRQIENYIQKARCLVHYLCWEDVIDPTWITTTHPVTGQWLLVRGKEWRPVGADFDIPPRFVPSSFIVLTYGKA